MDKAHIGKSLFLAFGSAAVLAACGGGGNGGTASAPAAGTQPAAPAATAPSLAAIAGLPAWSTLQGNAAHTGYIPATFSPSAFSQRWSLPALGEGSEGNPAAAANGRVFLSRYVNGGNWSLWAIDESSGRMAWQLDLGKRDGVQAPAAANGKVYLTSMADDSNLWIVDQASGAVTAKTALGNFVYRPQVPTVVGDAVYSSASGAGKVSRFDAADGRLLWSTQTLLQGNRWTPAADASYVYSYHMGLLYVSNAADGRPAYAIAGAVNSPAKEGVPPEKSVVLGDQMAFALYAGQLTAFDLTRKHMAWQINADTTGQPALANGIVYVVAADGARLEARTASNGALRWSASLPVNAAVGFNRLVVTDNLAFVSTLGDGPGSTVAIDLATHAVVWSHPLGGNLSISDRGLLYIVSQAGQVAAINLR